jgi:hypothetical protein
VLAVRRLACVTAVAIAAIAVPMPAAAQGNSGNAPGKNKDKKGTPPSTTALPGPTSTATSSASPISTATGASPLSWLDDASLLEPGSVLLTVSTLRWSGSGVSEVNFPIVDAAFGLTRRVQFSATVPRVVAGAEESGVVGGLGTSYFSTKIALIADSDIKLAVSPLVEVLGTGAVQSLPVGESRYQLGVPVSVEASAGVTRLFAAAGFFTRGAWFAGGGIGFPLTDEMGASVSVTRSWAKTDIEGVRRNRSELSGGVSYFLTQKMAVYGSLGHTIGTAAENGAGMSVGGGVAFFLVPGGVTK